MVASCELAIIGAGPSGIAAGVAGRARGLDVVLLEAGPTVAHRWRTHYDRLHLQALRRREGLPGRPIPRSVGRWVSRDAYAGYLDELAAESGLRIELGRRVERVEPDGDAWRLAIESGAVVTADQVVVATGQDRTEKLPDWPGLDSFAGRFMHSRGYRNAEPFAGLDVLVVGGGQSAAEIAVDLVEGNARRVWMAIRSTPIILPRQLTRYVCIQDLLGFAATRRVPPAVLDRALLLVHRLFAGDLTRVGLAAPSDGLMARMSRGAGAPILDGVGFLRMLKAGQIGVVPGVDAFDGDEVVCGNRRIRADVVIAATGFTMDLEPLVGHLGVLDGRGRPRTLAPEPALPGLYFLGYEFSPSGLLWKMGRQAPLMAESMFAGDAVVGRP